MPEPTVEVRTANWLELFYDLVFAAAVITFSDAVSGNPIPSMIGVVSVSFVAIWLVWLATTLYVNTFGIDDSIHRALVVLQMLLLTLSSLAVGDGLGHNPTLASLSFALLVLDVGVMYGRHARRPGPQAFARLRRNQYFVAAVPIVIAAFAGPVARDVLWPLGLVLLAIPTLGFRAGRLARTVPVREDHLVERLGLLTIIVMGEAFVKVALVVADGHLDSIDVEVLVALFAMMFAIWWSYFDAIPDAGIRPGVRASSTWLAGHVAFQWCLVGVAVAYAKWLHYDTLNSFTGERSLLGTVPLAGFLFTLLVIGLCTRRTPSAPLAWLRGGTAAAVVILGVVYWQVDGADVQTAAISLAVLALIQAVIASYLQRTTTVEELHAHSTRATLEP